MNDSDAERFDRIRRKIEYGATLKDLFWLVRLVEKLEKQLSAISSQPKTKSPKLKASL